MSEMDDLKARLGLRRPAPKLDSSEDASPNLVALAEYEAALKELVAKEEAYLEAQKKFQAEMEPFQKRFQEATRKLQLALLGKEEAK